MFTEEDNHVILITEVSYMTLKQTRESYSLSQIDAANVLGIPVRTLRRYETDEKYGNPLVRSVLINLLNERCEITEEKGILTLEDIKSTLVPILRSKGISFCYLFGSYAKGSAKGNSDVDLLIDTDITGLDFFNLVEEIRNKLHKKIDLVRLKDLQNGNPIILEILKEGIRLL